MKYLKMLGLAAVAVAAVMAFVGAGTASAETTLCKVTEDPCTEANMYPVGTEVKGQSIAGEGLAKPTLTSESFFGSNIACDSKINGKTETTTTPEGSVKVEEPTTNDLTWENCVGGTAQTITGGKIQVHWDVEHNGTVTMSGFVVKVVQSGITCYYGGTLEGTLTGSATEPIIHITTVVHKQTTAPHSSSFLCPTEPVWHATYKVTSPTPLYVSKGL